MSGMKEEKPEELAEDLLDYLSGGLKTQEEILEWYSYDPEDHENVYDAIEILMRKGQIGMYDVGTGIVYVKK